ncbi:unnamed protein product [Musa acuminata subsp. burmannicoides]
MMGSSYLDHYHQEELHGFSSLATVPAFYDLASNREWNQNQLLNCGDFVSNANGVLSGHRDFSSSHEISPASSLMVHDLGVHHWASNTEEGFMNQLPSHQLNAAKAKELSENSFPTLNLDHQLHQKLLARALASDRQIDGLQPLLGHLSESSSFAPPTANFSRSSPHPPLVAGSLDMDLHELDLLASARLGRSFCQTSLTGMALFGEDATSGLDHLQESVLPGPFHNHHLKMPSLASGVAEARRCNSTWEDKSSQTPPRKPRFEQQRSSFSPFKVRKEKLGDRIAALQQLVAPFGKTDTASVLIEAIGYIKFLLDQVEKLSVPYMRSCGSKRSRTMEEASNGESDEPRRDLRSRGLCLVPLSCTSYVTTEQGVWSPVPSSCTGSG